jgi:predicted DNA-binding protein
MKEIILSTKAEKQIGNVRISLSLYNKLDKISKDNGVTMSEVMRSILEQVIDEIKIK